MAMMLRVVCFESPSGSAIKADLSIMLWTGLALILLIMAILNESILPAHFLFDKGTLLEAMSFHPKIIPFGDSFDNFAALYNILGLKNWSMSLAGWAFSVGAMVRAVWVSKVESVRFVEWGIIVFWMIISIAYVGLPSKEILISAFVFFLLAFDSEIKRALYVVSAGAVICIFFRGYWVIVIAGAFALRYTSPRLIRPKWLFLALGVGYILLGVALIAAMGSGLAHIRESTNDMRSTEDIGSIITPFLPMQGFVPDILNILLILLSFFFPWPLFMSGNVTQFGAGIGLVATSIIFMWRWFSAVKQKRKISSACAYAFFYFFSFVFTQAVFEPDYGSFLRHISPVSPLIVLFILNSRSKALS
jgi:hypothetical protein